MRDRSTSGARRGRRAGGGQRNREMIMERERCKKTGRRQWVRRGGGREEARIEGREVYT